ncbi:MAG TPA: leucine-rich repeat protein, partial [Haloplasmataceae bacterium]
YVFITMPNYYLTLYARWEKIKETYTITFDSRGGSHVESITAEPDSPITKPENPTREGYVFLGWYENITSKEPYAFTTMPNNNITLYGRWEEIILGTEGLEYESQLDGTYKVTDYNGQEKNVIIPNFYNGKRVTKISSTTFKNCTSLTSVIIPEGITIIDDYAFNNLQSLIIYVKASSEQSGWGYLWNGGRPVYYAITEVLEYNDMQYIIIDGNITITRYFGYETILDVPSKIREYNVTSIGDGAFSNCINLINITIPEGITSIGNGAFSNCTSLKNITIPKGITRIADSTFQDCTNLTSITIQEGVTTIGHLAFYNCTSLASITLPNGLTSIGYNAFYNCISLINIIIPEGVNYIGGSAFSNCESLTSITLPESLKSIGYYAFYNCIRFYNCISLRSINLPKGITSIESGTFYRCISLISITIPEGVTSIDNVAFSRCTSLTSITLPEGLIEIGRSTFFGCTSLTNITIPESVTSIDKYAFANCINLTIYAKVSSEPSGWDSEWNFSNRPVYYGVD